MRIILPNDFEPRPYQKRYMAWFDKGGKRAVWVVHRRGGKDLTGAHQLCKMAHERRGVYWHVFPTFEQGRKAIWEGFRSDGVRIIDNVFPKEIVARRNNQEMMIELKCGSIYRIIGSDKIEVVGAGPAGVLFSEYSIAKPKAWDLISPMLRENNGWASFVYTPRGNNHGRKLFDMASKNPDWFCELQTLYDTRAYDPDVTVEEERKAGRPESLIRQEYLCDWTAANVGSVWGELIEKQEKAGAVGDFTMQSGRMFSTWDLGGSGAKGDATCFWLWAAREDGVDLLDYYEGTGKVLSHYFDEIDARQRAIGLRCVKHWLPHDARGHHLTGVTVLEECRKHWGAENVAIYPEMSLLDGIQAARRLLQRKIRVHPRCSEGWEALKAYHYEWDDDRKAFTSTPYHDWSSHPADGFRGLACVLDESERRTRPAPIQNSPAAVPLSGSFTLDKLFEDREKYGR